MLLASSCYLLLPVAASSDWSESKNELLSALEVTSRSYRLPLPLVVFRLEVDGFDFDDRALALAVREADFILLIC